MKHRRHKKLPLPWHLKSQKFQSNFTKLPIIPLDHPTTVHHRAHNLSIEPHVWKACLSTRNYLIFPYDFFFLWPSIKRGEETKMERWSVFRSIRSTFAWWGLSSKWLFGNYSSCRLGSMLPIVDKRVEVGLRVVCLLKRWWWVELL